MPKIEIKEMGLRDGLQNISKSIETSLKYELFKRLLKCECPYIELTSFVSPKAVPQMSDAKELSKKCKTYLDRCSALVPNERGMQDAIACGYKEVAVFTAASETFNQKNIRASIKESLERFVPIFALAKSHRMKVRAYISTAFVCPYEGKVKSSKVKSLAKRLLDMGAYEISIGDTIGLATPGQVQKLFTSLLKLAPRQKWAGHFHDTYGMGLANVVAAHELGIYKFDTSIGGLGGCPYAPGAGGNLASEDLVHWAKQEGIQTGLKLPEMIRTTRWIKDTLGILPQSKVYKALVKLS